MSEDYIRRFALILLKNNSHLGQFEVDVMDRGFASSLLHQFCKLGCDACLADHSAVLTVACPREVQERMLNGVEKAATPVGSTRG